MSPRPWREVRAEAFPDREQEVYGLLDQENPPGPAKHSSLHIHPYEDGFRLAAISHDEDGNDNIVIFQLGRGDLRLLASKLKWHHDVRPSLPQVSLADAAGAFPNFTDGKSSVEYIREMRQE